MSYQYGNLSDYMLVPDFLRETYLDMLDWYDKEWQPWFMQLMPKEAGPGRGSQRFWTRDRGSDPQAMARFYGDNDEIEPMNYPHVRPWSYNTRLIGNRFDRSHSEFAGDFKQGIIEKAHAELMENLTKIMNRNIEYALTRFAYGDTGFMATFTDQNVDRQGIARLDLGQFNGAAAAGLGGVSWDNFAAGAPPVFEDLAYLKKQYKRMANQNATYMMIGRDTEYNLELNDDLLDRLIRIQDTTQGVLGDYLMGLQLIKVVGQTFKDIPGANQQIIGMPGQGDSLEQTWQRLNKNDMMVETIGGRTFEWSIISGTKNIGSVKCGWVDDDHKAERASPTDIFIEQWKERNPKHTITTAKLHYCPYVEDYSNLMLVRAVAEQVD